MDMDMDMDMDIDMFTEEGVETSMRGFVF